MAQMTQSSAGALNERITILRRAVGSLPGRERGAFAPVLTRFAAWTFTASKAVTEGGRAVDAAEGKFTVRACAETKAITLADRVSWRGTDYSIVSVAPAHQRLAFVEIFVTSARNT